MIAFSSPHQKLGNILKSNENGQIMCSFFGFNMVKFGVGQACQDAKNELK
jgi:hypothetical protein